MEYSSLFVTLMGIGTVFFGLICIIFLTMAMGAILKARKKRLPLLPLLLLPLPRLLLPPVLPVLSPSRLPCPATFWMSRSLPVLLSRPATCWSSSRP